MWNNNNNNNSVRLPVRGFNKEGVKWGEVTNPPTYITHSSPCSYFFFCFHECFWIFWLRFSCFHPCCSCCFHIFIRFRLYIVVLRVFFFFRFILFCLVWFSSVLSLYYFFFYLRFGFISFSRHSFVGFDTVNITLCIFSQLQWRNEYLV